MRFALNGTETQIDSFAWVIHNDMDIDEEVVKLQKRFEAVFKGERAHLITRIITQRSSGSILTQAGRNDQHIADLIEYMKGLHTRSGKPKSDVSFPIDMQVLNFVSHTPLEIVE